MKYLFLITFMATKVCAQTSLFVEIREKQEKKLNSGDSRALALFWDEKSYIYAYSPNILFLGDYDYIDKDSKRTAISLKECGRDICLQHFSMNLRCVFTHVEIKFSTNRASFVMNSPDCRIKGANMEMIKKINTLVILDKKRKKFIVTGDLLRRRE